MADNFSALRTSRDEPSLFEAIRTAPQLSPEAQYEMTGGASDTQFEKGLRSGAAGLTAGSFANEALTQEVAGDEEWQRSRDLALQTQAQGGMYAPRVSSLRDIGGIEDAGDFAAGTMGQGLMSMAPTLATAVLTRGRGKLGAATSFAGAAGTAYNLERGEAALGQYADPTLAATDVGERDFAATAKGAVNAGLEAIVPAGLAGSILRRPAGGIASAIGRDALTEGVTEAAQQGVGFASEQYLDPNRQLDPWDVADAFASGALTGGGMSAAANAPGAAMGAATDAFARNPQESAAPVDPPADTTGELPPPDDGSGGGLGETFSTLNERFGPTLRDKAQSGKDYVADTIDRMSEAAKTAATPADFLRAVFSSQSDEAAADLAPDTEDPTILNAADPAAALAQRDAQRQERSAAFAEQLMASAATPDTVKERIAAMGGDFANPENQAFVARTLVAQNAGEKFARSVGSLIDLSKDLAGKAGDALGKVTKKNLQDTSPAEQATFNKLVFDNLTDEAKADPTVRKRLPELANSMLAFAARTGDLTKADLKTLSRMQDGLSLFADPEALAAQLTEYAGVPRPEDSFLARVKRVSNAQQDLRKPNSFLYSSLTEEAKSTLTQPQLAQVARLVDDFTLADAKKGQGDKVLAGLAAAFGDKDAAKAVLDYYQQQNRSDVVFDETDGATTERSSAPAPTYQFADAKAMRPYRTFVGSSTAEGGMRRRLRESTVAGASIRRASSGGANARPIKMSQYVSETGGNAEAEVKRIAADIKDRMEQQAGRKDEDRTQQVNELKGELTLMRQAYKQGGAEAALDLYEVLQVSEQEQNDTVATDEEVSKMATLADVKDAKDTRVTFQRTDGSKFTLSAESMWKTRGDREGSGKGENAQVRAKRLFADAVASVLARPEVEKLLTPMEKITVDRKLKLQAKHKGDPEYRQLVADALRASEGTIKSLEATLDEVVDEYMDAKDNEAKSEEYSTRREEIEAIIEKNIAQLSERLDAAREGEGPMAGNVPAQAVARQKLRMYRAAQGQIDAVKFDEEFDARDNDRAGIVENDANDDGPINHAADGEERGSDRYTRGTHASDQRMQDQEPAVQEAARRKAEDEALKKEPKSKTISDAATNALYDIAVKEEYGQLDTPEKVLRYATTARALMDQLGAIPEDARTDRQQELLSKLRDDFKQGGFADFDWDMLFDGMKPTDEQRALLKDIVSKKSAMGPKKGRTGPIDKQAILDEIARIRGAQVKVLFQKFSQIGGSGDFTMDRDKTNRVIRIAVNAANPMGVAWHESLHDFFGMLGDDRASRSIKQDLIDAGEAPHVKKQLRELLAKHPKALQQLEDSPEERVAYMYQFWAEGLLQLGPTSTGVFEKVRQFFRDVLGVVGAEERAADLLTALHEGRFADPSVVAEVLADLPADRFGNKLEKASPETARALHKVFSAAPDRLRAYQNDTITDLADMFSSERGKLGFIQKRFQQQGVWENKLAAVLAGSTAQERRAALENMQAMKAPSSQMEKGLVDFFSEIHDYLDSAGVKTLDSKSSEWVPLRRVQNYFPRQFDRNAIMDDRDGFSALLQKHGGLTAKQASDTISALVHGTGQLDLVESEHSLGFTPYAPAVQDRRFTFINPSNAAEFAKYQSKDMADIVTGYTKQAAHRAEYARAFGNNGERIAEMIGASGIKDAKELADIGKIVQGLEGSLGYEMSSSTKELMSGLMTLQNLVVLPLSIFSQMVDPIVLAARSGEIKDAGEAFVTAVKRLRGKEADGEELANMLGIISQDSVLEAMGNAYGTAHMSKRMRDVNRVFFKYNGMQGWNNSMRIAATAAGERYLLANKDDAKVLAELGLTPKDIKAKADGRLDVSSPQIQQAMYRFVDQAVIRPSASSRPVWMSDPRFQLVAHLKQFTYTMHNVVLKRASRELADGNPKPWTILLLTMPVMLAADMAKFALTGGPPPGWAFKDYLIHAVERSGLLGLGDFAAQATRGVETGAKVPGEALLGPSFEHLMQLLRWVGGDPRTGAADVVERTVPGARFF